MYYMDKGSITFCTKGGSSTNKPAAEPRDCHGDASRLYAMYQYSRKRKQRPEHGRRDESFETDNSETRREPDSALYVVAHEADIVRGPQAALAARSLEVVEYLPNQPPRKRIGEALIRWGTSQRQSVFHDEDDYAEERQESREEIWVDRWVILT